MRENSLWRALLGVEKTVIEAVEYDEDHDDGAGCVIVHAPAGRACSQPLWAVSSTRSGL